MKNVDIGEPMHTWDALNVNANQMKNIIEQLKKMFGSRISAGATAKLPGWENHRAKTVAWWS